MTKKFLRTLIREEIEHFLEATRLPNQDQFVLKGDGEWTWAYFTRQPQKDKIHVLALLGAVYYIDRKMPIEDARKNGTN